MVILIIYLIYPSNIRINPSLGNPDYTYYGVVPSKIYSYNLTDTMDLDSGWRLDTGSVGNASLLVIVAAENGTHVEVHDLMLNKIVSMFEINNMEKHYTLLVNGSTFKVVSNKQVSVMLLNYHVIPLTTARELALPFGFYLSTDGLYVGKKFVIMGSGQGINQDYTILAIEKARVTITKDDNTQLTYSLDANSYKDITLSPFRVYKIESTGNIMVQSGYVQGKGGDYVPCFAVPSVQGGFVGTFFLTMSLKSQEWGWDLARNYGFRVTALDDTKVKVYDLETKLVIAELTIKAGSGGRVQPESEAIAVQSDKPITLSLIHNGSIEHTSRHETGGGGGQELVGKYASYGNGVLFIGVKPNENTMVHLPTDAFVEAYFFANEETQLTIDSDTYTVHASSPFFYNTPGTHTVRTNNNVVLQMNFWPNFPEYQGLEYTGAMIPSIELVNINPTVTLTSIEGGFPIMYIAIGVAAAVIAVVVGLFLMRKRSKVG
jgi:hypothetical protein